MEILRGTPGSERVYWDGVEGGEVFEHDGCIYMKQRCIPGGKHEYAICLTGVNVGRLRKFYDDTEVTLRPDLHLASKNEKPAVAAG